MLSKLSFLLLLVSFLTAQTVVTVHMGTVVDSLKDLSGVNKGPKHQHVLGYADAGITTIRMHDYFGANDYVWYSNFWNFDQTNQCFTNINTAFNPDDPNDYDWSDFDQNVQYILNRGCQPYIRLGVSYPLTQYVIQPNDPPLDEDGVHFTKFARLAKQTIMHFNQGWDNGYYYDLKYWEIWNEPDGLFWSGTPRQFYQFYQTVAETLKTLNPDLIIGGPGVTPATTIGVNDAYLDRFLDYLRNNDVPLDFYSWHLYGIHNPYMLGEFARNIRQKLDERGFTNAESHVTEINHQLRTESYLDDSAKGAAFYASLLITAQKSPIDKIFWYPGDAFFFDDSAGQGRFKWGAYPIACFSEMHRETPVQVQTEGDVVLDDFWDVDTTNFMALAARSTDNEKLTVLISNYNSDLTSYTVRIDNAPWQNGDTLLVTQKISREPNERFVTIQYKTVVSDPLTLEISDMPAPSVLYLKLQRVAATGIESLTGHLPEVARLLPNYPNPFNPSTIIRYTVAKNDVPVRLTVYNMLGEQVAVLVNERQKAGHYSVPFDAHGLPAGLYFYRLKAGSFGSTKKMILLR